MRLARHLWESELRLSYVFDDSQPRLAQLDADECDRQLRLAASVGMSRADFKPEKCRQLVGTVNAAKRKERAAKTAGEKLLGSSGGFLPSFEQMAIELGRQEDYDFFYRGG